MFQNNMPKNPFFEEMVALTKMQWENSSRSLTMWQEQSEKMMEILAKQTEEIQGTSQEFFQEWVQKTTQQQESYRETFTSQWNELENFLAQNVSAFTQNTSPEKPTEQKTPKAATKASSPKKSSKKNSGNTSEKQIA